MKKFLFLLLICVIKLNAYEYDIWYSNSNDVKQIIYYDINNKLNIKYIDQNGVVINNIGPNATTYLANLGQIARRTVFDGDGYISKEMLTSYLKSDLNLINDFYLSSRSTLDAILNFLYNENNFSANNYIVYDNYELLYNSDGLAVESIVDGVWAGLYDDNEKSQSGDLYDNLGRLQYYNGNPATPVDSFYVWLASFTHRIVGEVFQELSRAMIFGTILCIILVLAMLYFCIENFLFVPRKRSRPYYLYGEDGSRHTFRQAELEGKNYARLNPEWAQRRLKENERARAGR